MSARELLLFAHDHATAGSHPAKALAALPKPFDLVAHQSEELAWGKEDLKNPWFRIVVWLGAPAEDLDSLLSPMREIGGDPGNPQFLSQYRGFSLSFDEPGFMTWWKDATRAMPKYILKAPPRDIAEVKRTRPVIANPAFIGISSKLIG